MPDRPLILFPSPERADREHKSPVFTRTVKPSFGRQFTRLQPSFNVLRTAFEQKALKFQQSPTGINPEFALVFEIIGSVDNFYTAVKHTDFKTACAVLIVTNTWNIVMGVFDVAQSVVNSASGIIVSDTSIALTDNMSFYNAPIAVIAYEDDDT